MRNWVAVTACVCAVLAAGRPAQAQDANTQSDSRAGAQITPYASLGSAASKGLGAGVTWQFTPKVGLELETDYRVGGARDAVSSSVSLIYDLPRIGRVTPYVAGGAGIDQYSFAHGSAGRPIVTLTGTAFTVNAGGGLKMPIDQTWGMRTDARWFNGIGRNAPERWRLYNGVTFRRP
jgi:hypothetical protein